MQSGRRKTVPFESRIPVAVIAGNLEYRMNPRMLGFRLGRTRGFMLVSSHLDTSPAALAGESVSSKVPEGRYRAEQSMAMIPQRPARKI